MQDLIETQRMLETLTYDEAVARQRSELEKRGKRKEGSETRSGRYYVKNFSRVMVPRLTSFLHPDKKAGRHHIAAKLLLGTGLELETIAHMAVKGLLDIMYGGTIKKGVKRTTLSVAMAEGVHEEWRMRVFADDKERKALLKKLFKDFDKRTYPPEWRKRTIKSYFEAEQISWEGWTDKQRKQIGYALLCVYREATADTFGEGKPFLEAVDGETKFMLSDEAIKHIGDLQEHLVTSFTLYQPMVIPPKPWTTDNLFRGGYHSNSIKRYAIVKGAGRRDVERFNDMDWSRVLPAINAVQETPWRVNRVMVEALDWAYNELSKREEFKKQGIGKLVSCEKLDLPPEPLGYGDDEKITKRHNKTCFLIHSRNREDKSRRIAAEMTIKFAKRYAEYDAIYFPHNMDSRGRIYPLPAVLNPQGPDYCKAVLEFAQGEPIETEEHSFWLAVAGANAYGNDKISLEERVKWVRDNEELIRSVAANFRTDLRWVRCGEPFGFLRFCLEWTAFLEQGYGYVSHMVVPVDATCSGLQHYAAMMRDGVGGKSVNLVPGLSRQDIYGDVASVVITKLMADGSPMALDWVTFGIDRKITKRQVMVVPYAGKFSSCLAYTREAVTEKLYEGYPCPWDINDEDDTHNRIVYLSQLIWAAIDEVVVKGKLAMQWLSKAASEFAKLANSVVVDTPYDRRMTWNTPDGFEVLHYREDQDRVIVQTYFKGKVQLVSYEYNGRLNTRDMGLAVAPNFVHALDANLLRATVILALNNGINHFGMIHDSFGCHARFMSRFLSDCVKPAFVEMYEKHDVLAEFRDHFSQVLPLDPLPEKGTLDLQGVLKSEFFFS